MKYIVNTSNDPAYNIALEAYAFRELVDEDELFILWINRPAIIVGKHQNTIQEINKEYTDAHDIKVVRRLSGGGAVYHDLNNLNYTIISNKADESQHLLIWALRLNLLAVTILRSMVKNFAEMPKPTIKVV